MSLIITLIMGGLAGYVASLILNRNEGMGIILNIIVGVIGAALANLLIAPLVGIPAQLDTITLSGFLMSVLGAVVLLALVNLVTRRSIR